MVTTNFENLSKMLLAKSSVNQGLLPCKAVDGVTYYLSNLYQSTSYPYTQVQAFTLTEASAGISVGSGSTAATKNDTNLESTITSGLEAAMFTTLTGLDENDFPFVRYEFILKNVSNSSITIREIGVKQSMYAATAFGGNSSENRVCLIDRTVLSEPLVIAPNDVYLMQYTLKTL